MRPLLTTILLFIVFQTGFTAQVIQVEYAFDTDPGVGNATAADISDGTDVSSTLDIPIGSLSKGFHKLFMRMQDENGSWSHTQQRTFYVDDAGGQVTDPKIVAAEILVDTETGYRTGQRIDLPDGDTSISTVDFNISGLAPGFHKLLVRTLDDRGRWSHTSQRSFYVEKTNIMVDPEIVAAEYFFDSDPGAGSGTALTYTKSDSITEQENIPVNGLTPGWHYFGYRLKDNRGNWSMPSFRSIFIDTIQLPAPTSYVADKIEYWIDEVPAQGSGTRMDLDPGDTAGIMLSLPMNTYSEGLHRLYARYHSSGGFWSPPESRIFWVQTITPPATPSSPIVAAEYFIGDDPGLGKGTSITITKGDSVIINQVMDVSALNLDQFHKISYRFRDSLGNWSVAATDSFIRVDCDLPEQPLTPTGAVSICSGTSTANIYTAELPNFSDTLIWDLIEKELIADGTVIFSPQGTTASIAVQRSYSGTLTLRVRGENECVFGNWSDPLQIQVSGITELPGLPVGSIFACPDETVKYFTDTTYGDVSYEWNIQPSEAGMLNPTADSASVTWANDYSGTAFLKYRYDDGCNTSEFSDPLNILVGAGNLPVPTGDQTICEAVQGIYEIPDFDSTIFSEITWHSIPAKAVSPIKLTPGTMQATWTLSGGIEPLGLYAEVQNKCGNTNYSDTLWVTPLPDQINIELDVAKKLTSCFTSPEILDIPVSNYNDILTYSAVLIADSLGTVSFIDNIYRISWKSLDNYPDSAGIVLHAEGTCGSTVQTDTTVWVHFVGQAESLEFIAPDSLCASVNQMVLQALLVEADSFRWTIPFLGEFYTTDNVLQVPGFSDVIPADYTLRVYPINACGEHTTGFTSKLNIKPSPAAPYIPDGKMLVCASDQSVYQNKTTGNDYLDYSWTINPAEAGVLTGNKDSLIVNWKDGFEGIVYVSITGETDCGLASRSDSLPVEVNTNRITSLVAGDTLYCPEDTASFILQPGMPISRVDAWSIDPQFNPSYLLQDTILKFIVPRTKLPETVNVSAWVNNGCGLLKSEPLQIYLNQAPPPLNITGNDTICDADTAIYGLEGSDSYEMYWQVVGAVEFDTVGQKGNLKMYNPDPGGTINMTLTYTDKLTGCNNISFLSTLALPSPFKAVITKKGNRILIYQDINASEYQWYIDGKSIPGAVGQFYAPDTLQTGEYHVVAKNLEGCPLKSELYSVGDGMKSDRINPLFDLVPNPARTQFRLVFEEEIEGKIRIQAFDSRSVIWYNEDIDLLPVSGRNTVEMDASTWDRGIYFIRVIRDGVATIKKIIMM